jgi:hypothetical protein
MLEAPQLVTGSRMLYFTYLPAEPAAVRDLVPPELELADNGQCFINQYVVDSADQTSGFDAYSLTYCGADLKGQDTPDGAVPGRWWLGYLNSDADMRAYAAVRGVPAEPGTTTLELADGILTATTSDGAGNPVIRSTARVGEVATVGRGQLRYLTSVDGRLTSGLYPFVAPQVAPWEVLSFEFLDPASPLSVLRPADPLQVTWGFYSPSSSFCYPGGESTL